MKTRFLIAVLLLALVLSGCGSTNVSGEKGNAPISGTTTAPVTTTTQPTRITEEEAVQIASDYWGVKSGDVDEKTGFPYLIMPVQSKNDNIRIDWKWLVNNETYSTLDSVEIDPYTGAIVTPSEG